MRYVMAGILIMLLALVGAAFLFQNEHSIGTGGKDRQDREMGPTANLSILESLQKDGHFKILLSALKDTEIEKTLSGKGPVTFFAPTDEAFERVPKLAELLNTPDMLREVLNHHLLADSAMDTCALFKAAELHPKSGEPLKITCNDRLFQVNDARIPIPDIKASNGFVHGIDRVLMKDNNSILRDAGETIERGLKKGTEKIKDTFKSQLNKDEPKREELKTGTEK